MSPNEIDVKVKDKPVVKSKSKSKTTNLQIKKKRIAELFNHWLKVFGLLPSKVSISYEKESNGTVFDIMSHFPYRKIELRVFPAGLELTDNELSCSLMHEALHVVLEPMCCNRLTASDIFNESCEMVVENLAHHLHAQLKTPRLPKV